MRLGIIGRGYWGDTYARTLDGMDIDYVQMGRDWHNDYRHMRHCDGVIIATTPASHFQVALRALRYGLPMIIEKPVCLNSSHAGALLLEASTEPHIVFTGHTRLYSPAWMEFKSKLGRIDSVYMQAGGPSPLGWLWGWGPHLVAMCLDLGYDPMGAQLLEMHYRSPIAVTVNGHMHFFDIPTTPTALEVLITDFCRAIEKGEPNIEGLRIGVKVVEGIEALEARRVEKLLEPA